LFLQKISNFKKIFTVLLGMATTRKNSKRAVPHGHECGLATEDIPRFFELDVIASMQPTHCLTDKRFCEKRIGQERSKYAYA